MKVIYFLLMMVTNFLYAQAQHISPQVTASAGETYQTNNVQIDWTLGELAITAMDNSNHQITQGFHQPYYTITNADELPKKIGEIKVFPNPVMDKLEMKLYFEQQQSVTILLFDATGRIVWTKEVEGQTIEETAEVSTLPAGQYFLKFQISEQQESSIFKILKIK